MARGRNLTNKMPKKKDGLKETKNLLEDILSIEQLSELIKYERKKSKDRKRKKANDEKNLDPLLLMLLLLNQNKNNNESTIIELMKKMDGMIEQNRTTQLQMIMQQSNNEYEQAMKKIADSIKSNPKEELMETFKLYNNLSKKDNNEKEGKGWLDALHKGDECQFCGSKIDRLTSSKYCHYCGVELSKNKKRKKNNVRQSKM